MPDPANIFETEQTTAPVTTTTAQTPNYADLLAGIKNESGAPKYSSVDEALKALAHSQAYIPELKTTLSTKEQEILDLRAQLSAQSKLEETIARLADSNRNNEVQTTSVPSGLDEQAVNKLLDNALASREAAASSKANTAKVQSALVAKFGEKAQDEAIKLAESLGTTIQELGVLASKNPDMVLKLFNTTAPKGAPMTTSSINIPPINKPNNDLVVPEKSLLRGAKTSDQVEFMRQIRARVYAENGITE